MEDDIYKEHILDHYRNPRNKREIKNASGIGKASNISCGDETTLYLKFSDSKVEDASFTGSGCAISQAAASLLTEKLKELPLSGARALTPGDMYNLLGIKISPGRVKCTLLAYEAMAEALGRSK